MVAIAFYSITGQTERFIKKTQLSAHQIDDANPKYDMGKSYILIVPSYQDFMMDSVVDFLTYKDNKKNIIGIIGCGNRNFNDLCLFCIFWNLVVLTKMSKMYEKSYTIFLLVRVLSKSKSLRNYVGISAF